MPFHDGSPDFTHLTDSLGDLRSSLLEKGFSEPESFVLTKIYFTLTLEAHLCSPAFMQELRDATEGEEPFSDPDNDEDDYPYGLFDEGDE